MLYSFLLLILSGMQFYFHAPYEPEWRTAEVACRDIFLDVILSEINKC